MTRFGMGQVLSPAVPEWRTSVRVAGSFAQRPACTWGAFLAGPLDLLAIQGILE